MKQIAHRGYSIISKDNTKDAFEKAIQYNFDMIELDIQISSDKQIFIYHDTIFDNMILENFTLQEIQFVEPSILTLFDFYNIIKDETIEVYLDLKGNNIELCHSLIEFFERHDIIGWYVGSFNLTFLQELTNKTSMQYLGLITENGFTENLLEGFMEKIPLQFISIHWTMLNHKSISFLHKLDLKVFTYTCKNRLIEGIMKTYAVDGIVTNYHFH